MFSPYLILQTKEPIESLKADGDQIEAVAFTHDGSKLLTHGGKLILLVTLLLFVYWGDSWLNDLSCIGSNQPLKSKHVIDLEKA